MATLILVQAALAGGHLSGNTGAIGFHAALGTSVLTSVGLLLIVLTALAVRHNWRLLVAAVVGWLGVAAQITLGYGDLIAIHVPLGVALFGLYLTLALAGGRTKEKI